MPLKVKSFYFKDWRFKPEEKKIVFNYQLETAQKNISFEETIILPKVPVLKDIPQPLLKQVLSSLHLILGISYYKIYCPEKIILKQPLTKEQAVFWQTIYRKGLGEFAYRNNLNPNKLGRFPDGSKQKPYSYRLARKNRLLLGLGGGKDSLVAGELLKKQGMDFTGFLVQTIISGQEPKNKELAKKTAQILGTKTLTIKRQLDKKIIQFWPDGYNGHIPISAVYAWLGLLAALLYDYRYFAVANEQSSNFGNLNYHGMVVNHQWSKSGEFENLFQNYLKSWLTTSINYFSLLRPFYEIRIAEMFSHYPKYFPYFSSCNVNFKISQEKKSFKKALWCGHCPKCLFVFMLLSAFLTKKELLKIFGHNLYQDKNLLPLFGDLLGFGSLKPFDCVGTFEESRAAFYLASKNFKKSLAHKAYLKKIKNPKALIRKVLKLNYSPNLPDQFKLLGIKNVLLLGYGLEGKTTDQYLKDYYPKLKVGRADQKNGPNYLNRQKDFEVAIKTPGLHKDKITIPYTTATNLFFSQAPQKIIGITGTKGKSTTTSLIYHLLKTAGFKAELIGNIGQPMLKALLKKTDPQTILVIELSSYQLDDIKYSPHIAVAINLFPDHMNYHKNQEKYYLAKKNITNFQGSQDFFIYNKNFSRLRDWAKETMAQSIAFNQKKSSYYETSLLGQHNQENIQAAVAVAKLFKIKDQTIKKALATFRPLPHRLELVGEYKKIKFYDDAISTTPESTIMAIKALKDIDTIFLGGQDRGYDFKELEKVIRQYKIRNIVLFPDSGQRIIKVRKGLNILNTKKMSEAVNFAYQNTRPGKICLLSTASPSYSLWQNFEEKGNQFQKWAKDYGRMKN